jgi:hypothetical protein
MDVTAVLRLEGAAVAAVALWVYAQTGAGWGVFLALILLPDVSMLGYLAGARSGAAAYNAAHSYLCVLCLFAVATIADLEWATAVASLWTVHIGADRAMGYGLKHVTGFRDTHLSARRASQAAALQD